VVNETQSRHACLKAFSANPLGMGVEGGLAAIFHATYFLVVLDKSLFPPGTYPRAVLMLPGLNESSGPGSE
jgi:hypothetical protein